MNVLSSHRKDFNTRPGARNEVTDAQREASRPAQEISFIPGLKAVSAKIQEVASRIDDILLGRVFADPFLDQLQQGVTATAILAQRQQRAQMMGPAVSSYVTRILVPLIMRFKSLLDESGLLPPLPPALARMRKMPRALLSVGFVSPMQTALRMDSAQANLAFAERVAVVARLDPQAKDKLNADQLVDELARDLGASGSIVRSDLEVAQIREARAEKMRRPAGNITQQQE
jgi:hypothetical protein